MKKNKSFVLKVKEIFKIVFYAKVSEKNNLETDSPIGSREFVDFKVLSKNIQFYYSKKRK